MTYHSDYDKYGFKADEIYEFLDRNDIRLGQTESTVDQKKFALTPTNWIHPLRAMPTFKVWEAACIMANDDPYPPDYGGYETDPDTEADIRRYKRLLLAAIDAGDLPKSNWSRDPGEQEIPHPVLRGWCERNELPWPIPTSTPRPATNAEALTEIAQLHAENERLKAELAEAKEGASFAEHPHWPEELDIAMIAWRAALIGANQSAKKPGAFIRDWLDKTYKDKLTKTQKDRIAVVANWDKTPGPK